MSHHQILVQKLTILSSFFPRGWKKLIFGEREDLTIPSLVWKNGKQIFPLPEVTGVWSDRKWKNFETGSQKIYFWKACEKLFQELYTRFLISSHEMAVEVFEVLSATMTSTPGVVRTKKISSILGFQDPLNSVLNSVLPYGLRAFASLGRIDALILGLVCDPLYIAGYKWSPGGNLNSR